MATAKSVAIRRAEAIRRIAQALGAEVERGHRDPAQAEALTLEAIAEAVEQRAAPRAEAAEPDAPAPRSRKANK